MEEHKERALIHFLERAKKPLDGFVSGIKEIGPQLRDSYKNLNDDASLKFYKEEFWLGLMIVDGCFMLEVMRVNAGLVEHYSSNDPIFSSNGMLYNLPYIRRDMLMFENQLPLLVLDKLVAVESGKERAEEGQINNLVLKFLSPNKTIPTAGVGLDLGLHPLDLYRKSLIQLRSSLELQVESRMQEPSSSRGTIRFALELDEVGIRFKKSETESLQDITFHDNVLSLPVIVVDEFTEHVFLNLMLLERFHGGNEVTNYVLFMNNIIDSPKDASLLVSKGIIKNHVGSNSAVANIFDTLPKDAAGGFNSGSNHNEVNRKLNDHCRKKRNRWRKKWNRWLDNLISTYFSSPWSFLSLAAAIILLALTVAQTLYTILSYYHR